MLYKAPQFLVIRYRSPGSRTAPHGSLLRRASPDHVLKDVLLLSALRGAGSFTELTTVLINDSLVYFGKQGRERTFT